MQADPKTGWAKSGCSLRFYLIRADSQPVELEGDEKRSVWLALASAIVRTKPETAEPLLRALADAEASLGEALRRPADSEISQGIRHAVTPIFAVTVSS